MLNGSVTPLTHPASRKARGCVCMHLDAQTTRTHAPTSLALSHAPKKLPKRAAPFSWHATCQAIPPALHRLTPTPDWLKPQLESCKPLSHRNPCLRSLSITEKKIGEKKKDTRQSKRHYVARRLALPSLLTLFPPFAPLRRVFVALLSHCMTFHVHQLTVETKRGERTAPTAFSILTTSRLPSADVAAAAAPLPSPLRVLGC